MQAEQSPATSHTKVMTVRSTTKQGTTLLLTKCDMSSGCDSGLSLDDTGAWGWRC